MHFHMHVIPRYEGGPKEIANWTPGSATAEELTEAAEKIKGCLQSFMIKRMDEEAKARFEEMYLTYQDTLRRLAYAYDIPVDDIDDIIQDTFVSYARYDYSLDQPEMGKKLLLGKILKNRCMDYHRQKKRRICENLEGEEFAAEEYRMQAGQPGLVDIFSGKERCKAILDEVDRRP